MTAINQNAILVPQRAISELQGRYQVALVAPDNKISIRDVQVGDQVGEMWIIRNGLKEGDRVVSEGVSKIRDGEIVNPKPDHSKFQSPYSSVGGAL